MYFTLILLFYFTSSKKTQPTKLISWHPNDATWGLRYHGLCKTILVTVLLWSFYPTVSPFQLKSLWLAFSTHVLLHHHFSQISSGWIWILFRSIQKACFLGQIWLWDMVSPQSAPHQLNPRTTDVATCNNKKWWFIISIIIAHIPPLAQNETHISLSKPA